MKEKKNAIDNFTIWDDVRSYFRESAESYFWIDTMCKKSESDNTRVCLHIESQIIHLEEWWKMSRVVN